MPVETLPDADALLFAERAREEDDQRWVPITAAFAEELMQEGNAAQVELGVHAIPRTHRWDENSLCYCVLPADKHRWRSHGLLRIMTVAEFTEWHNHWRSEGLYDQP